MGVGLRMGGHWCFWAVATPGGGSGRRCWSVGALVLAVLVASGDVSASPCHSWRRVPLVFLMVRVVDVMVSLMPMVLPRIRALWVVMLRVGGVVAGDADGEGAVGDAPGDADAESVAGDALVYGVAGDADGEGGVGGIRFYGAAGDDDGEGAVGAIGGSGCGSACGWSLGRVRRQPLLILAEGPVGGVAGRLAHQSCWCLW